MLVKLIQVVSTISLLLIHLQRRSDLVLMSKEEMLSGPRSWSQPSLSILNSGVVSFRFDVETEI